MWGGVHWGLRPPTALLRWGLRPPTALASLRSAVGVGGEVILVLGGGWGSLGVAVGGGGFKYSLI